jgi:hypothetical protein
MLVTTRATSATTCSQLSIASSNVLARIDATTLASSGRSVGCAMPTADAIAAITSAASPIGARSTNHTPSG